MFKKNAWAGTGILIVAPILASLDEEKESNSSNTNNKDNASSSDKEDE